MADKTVRALIYTNNFRVEGCIHLLFRDSYRGRLSDHLNSDRTPVFLPITEAKVYEIEGSEPIFEPECIIINRNKIEVVIELKED